MFQEFKKSTAIPALLTLTLAVSGCATSSTSSRSGTDPLLDDVTFDPSKEVDYTTNETNSEATTAQQRAAEAARAEKAREKAQLAFKDKVWDITQECGDLRKNYNTVGENLRLAELKAARNEMFADRIRPSKRARQEKGEKKHINRHQAQLARVADAINQEYNNLKKLSASTTAYNVPGDDFKKCHIPERPRNLGLKNQ